MQCCLVLQFPQDINRGVLISRGSVTGGSSTSCLPLKPWASFHFGAKFEASDSKCSPHSLFPSLFCTQVITQAAFSGITKGDFQIMQAKQARTKITARKVVHWHVHITATPSGRT